MKFSITDFFSKFDQIRRKLWICSNLQKKSVMENFIFCEVYSAFVWDVWWIMHYVDFCLSVPLCLTFSVSVSLPNHSINFTRKYINLYTIFFKYSNNLVVSRYLMFNNEKWKQVENWKKK